MAANSSITRTDGRKPNDLRPIRLERGWLKYADGSCLVEFGNTRVACAATISDRVPGFLRGTNTGWVTAEYGMIPRACLERNQREAVRGKQDGRTMEIQRLIGRSLRSAVDLNALGENTIVVDCDVLQGDGGTRTAAVTGGFVAAAQAIETLQRDNIIKKLPLLGVLGAVSVGIVNREELLDLNYDEDSRASADINVVMLEGGKLVEVQATAEGLSFSSEQLNRLIALAQSGINDLIELQKKALEGIL